jgi:hypothetical protein
VLGWLSKLNMLRIDPVNWSNENDPSGAPGDTVVPSMVPRFQLYSMNPRLEVWSVMPWSMKLVLAQGESTKNGSRGP